MCGIAALLNCKSRQGNTAATEKHGANESHDVKQSLLAGISRKISRRGPDSLRVVEKATKNGNVEVCMVTSVLHLRGDKRVDQPLVDENNENVFSWNGEIFGGYPSVKEGESDTISVYVALKEHLNKTIYQEKIDNREKFKTCLARELLRFFSRVEGPFAFLYYHHATSTVWWGRDGQGRRSLVISKEGLSKSGVIVSSASFQVSEHAQNTEGASLDWEDVPPTGIFSASLELSGKVLDQEAVTNEQNIQLDEYKWEDSQRVYYSMASREQISPPDAYIATQEYDTILFKELISAVRRRLPDKTAPQQLLENNAAQDDDVTKLKESKLHQTNSQVAVLFSGGLDSTVVAALLNQELEDGESIDLLNVCFDHPSHKSPDRVTALASYKDLKEQFPNRQWNLVLVNVTLDEVLLHQEHLLELIAPMRSQMDFNIGAALWFAARGKGHLLQPGGDTIQVPCHSNSRIIYTGVGADEQLGGYGRHRSSFHKHGGWIRLQEELLRDTNRLWLRNHGRDDRCISDHGKEPRYPFLDENVVRTLSKIPLWEITDPRLDKGVGDKLILRNVAMKLGLKTCSVLPKRAIQFGSRIAKQSAKRAKRDGGTRHVKGTDVFTVAS